MSDTDAGATAEPNALRTPIVAVLGHVDHGKTTLLDQIRGSAVSDGEAGAITQHIGATAVPLATVSGMAGDLVDPTDFDLPGLLFIDTPGHHSFTTLRSRGGALADIAVVVVDVNDGFQPQTIEALEILERTGTPFVVAANKIDTTPGWNPQEGSPIQASYETQSEVARSRLDENLYEIIGDLSDEGFSADLYWRVQNFAKNVGVVPLSAITSEGIPDLLAVLMGLSQRYMKDQMAIDTAGPGAGTVLEVKDERGFGATVDIVLYDGSIRAGDEIVVGGLDGPIVTEVRALLQPRRAATIEEVESELAEIQVSTEEEGVVVKADTLGSLEAMANALREAEVPILRAEVGDVAPRDVAVASTANEEKHRVVLGFNVEVLSNAADELDESEVRLFDDDVIYQLVDDYEAYVDERERAQQETVLDKIVRPCRFRILEDHVFRQSDPAVVGVEVLSGTLKNNQRIVKWAGSAPTRVGQLSGIQEQGEDVSEARAGTRVSIAIDGPTVGRQIEEGDELWIELPEKHAKILEQELSDDIPADELEALTGYLDKHRSRDPFWGK